MFLGGRPLLDTKADAKYFVDREAELSSVLNAVGSGLNAIVFGKRGSGKTSLLRQAAYRLRADRLHRVTFVDAAAAGDAVSLLRLIAERLVGPEGVNIPAPNSALGMVERSIGRYETRPTVAGEMLNTVDRLRRELTYELSSPGGDEDGPWWEPDEPAVVFVDGPTPRAAHTIFGQLRDEMWSLPITWIVSGDEDRRAGYLTPPADAFFEEQVTLRSLSPSAAVELLSRRLDDDMRAHKDVLRDVISLTDRQPRSLVSTARTYLPALLNGSTANIEQVRQRRDAAKSTLAELGRGATMLVAELRARGGAASASDEALLESLGWTRSRAVQVLRQLEDAGLVVSSEQRGEGAGRPRKVYELAEPVL